MLLALWILVWVYLGPQQFDSDVTGSLLAGTLKGRMKVYIDPYAGVDYFTLVIRVLTRMTLECSIAHTFH